MSITIEIDNLLQSYSIVSGLLDRREWEKEHGTKSNVEAIDAILQQFEGTAAGALIVDIELTNEEAGEA